MCFVRSASVSDRESSKSALRNLCVEIGKMGIAVSAAGTQFVTHSMNSDLSICRERFRSLVLMTSQLAFVLYNPPHDSDSSSQSLTIESNVQIPSKFAQQS